MKKPSDKQINAVEATCRTSGFSVFIDWLNDNRNDILEALSNNRDVIAIHQLQGQAMMLQDLIKTLQAIGKKS